MEIVCVVEINGCSATISIPSSFTQWLFLYVEE